MPELQAADLLAYATHRFFEQEAAAGRLAGRVAPALPEYLDALFKNRRDGHALQIDDSRAMLAKIEHAKEMSRRGSEALFS